MQSLLYSISEHVRMAETIGMAEPIGMDETTHIGRRIGKYHTIYLDSINLPFVYCVTNLSPFWTY